MSYTLASGDRAQLIDVLDDIFDRTQLDGALRDWDRKKQLENIVGSNRAGFLEELGDCIDNAAKGDWLAQLFQIAREATVEQTYLDALAAIERRCVEKQFRVTPGDHWGRAAVRLVDRQAQDDRLRQRVKVPPMPVHIFLLPGDEKAAHESYMERFRYATLPWLLGQPADSLRNVTEVVRAEWINKPPEGSELPYIVSKLRQKLNPGTEETAQAFRKIEKFQGKIVLVQHVIWEACWSDRMMGLIGEYARFWSCAENAGSERPWFFIFLNLIFDQEEGPPAVMGELERFELEMQCPGCSVTLLPYLPLVGKIDVHSWLLEHLPGQQKIGKTLLQRLFPERNVRVAMEQLEEELHKLVEEEE